MKTFLITVIYMLGFFAALVLIFGEEADTAPIKRLELAHTKSCDDSIAQKVKIDPKRVTVLSFPVAPKEIVPGEPSFYFKRIKNDLAVQALVHPAHTNVFVYLLGRRCIFDFVTVAPGLGDDLLTIMDPKDRGVQVEYK